MWQPGLQLGQPATLLGYPVLIDQNRRYQLDTLIDRLAYACARTAPHPYRVIIAG